MENERRPWGTYRVLYDGDDCKVKKITIDPGQSLSYQYHHKRSERWTVVSGVGQARINNELHDLECGTSVFIPAEARHTATNTSDDNLLVFIEIQTGVYFGEDDIVRLEDLYGRV